MLGEVSSISAFHITLQFHEKPKIADMCFFVSYIDVIIRVVKPKFFMNLCKIKIDLTEHVSESSVVRVLLIGIGLLLLFLLSGGSWGVGGNSWAS